MSEKYRQQQHLSLLLSYDYLYKDEITMIRIIVVGLIIYLLIQIFKRWAANKSSVSSEQKSHQENHPNNMVQCTICQLHIPEDEALQRDGKFYCSQAHLDGKQD